MKTYYALAARLSTLAATLVVALLIAAPLRADKPDRNIVFFITDDESPTLGCYGDKVAVTPAIDAIAAEGTRFVNAFATTASCSASRSVVLTGLHNHMNGQYGHTHHYHKFSSYPDVVQLALPRLLAQAGYRTARCGKYHVAPEAVFHFEETIPGNSRSDVEMAENCRAFLTKEDDRPFFLYFALSDPHRGGQDDQTSKLELKPNLFGNLPKRRSYPEVEEVFYDPAKVPVPSFLPDTPETREELAQYYQSCSRIDQGLARLVSILKEAGVYDKTLIVFTADHGMAFAGGKTTVYEPGLRVPFVVRDPYATNRGAVSDALISHVDITPSLLDFAGALDREKNAPKQPINANQFWKERGEQLEENRSGGNKFNVYHGKSWIPLLSNPGGDHHKYVIASHTFHEIQMYYPMRVYRDKQYKIIWNIAHKLDYPFASDLWAASSWQAQWKKGPDAPYGGKTVREYVERPEFEFYDIERDPHETKNLAKDPAYASTLEEYKAKLKAEQKRLHDPWVMKWDYQ
ncbi:sulfatase [Blastopirellula marina]|uniref:Heparan N-sulfatase n=1 Tax=Blastopirellula marina TaxID=124 RepID=A0A2S8GG95_9BACT|nr:sulfatase [Blastopirellula marina]PQO43486.1 heparan N-sulfatase [Blastopirellula marina]